jgi:hypothetical protein
MSLRDRLRRLFGGEARVEPRDPPGVVASPAGPLVADPEAYLVEEASPDAGEERRDEDSDAPPAAE